jgi:hypothetical protein
MAAPVSASCVLPTAASSAATKSPNRAAAPSSGIVVAAEQRQRFLPGHGLRLAARRLNSTAFSAGGCSCAA